MDDGEQSEASYIQLTSDEAGIRIHDGLDGLTDKLRTLELALPIDTANNRSEDFTEMRRDLAIIRQAVAAIGI